MTIYCVHICVLLIGTAAMTAVIPVWLSSMARHSSTPLQRFTPSSVRQIHFIWCGRIVSTPLVIPSLLSWRRSDQVFTFHLGLLQVFGTVACRVMWMWKDSYGSSGLGLDITMAEAYGGGMDTFEGINTYPMQNSPMMNMPLPGAFSTHGLRTHSYSSLIGATMMINAFDMCGGNGQSQYQNRHIDIEISSFGAEASELVPALFSQQNLQNGAVITTTVHQPLVVPRQP
eukprot:COSAG02_NODE_9309_length_2259_cov_3.884722_3_plen_228_part_01